MADRVRAALTAYTQTLEDVVRGVDASAVSRDRVESECLYAATELVAAVDEGLEGAVGAAVRTGGDVVTLVRLLLGAADRTANTLHAAETQGQAGGEEEVMPRSADVLLRPAVSVTGKRPVGDDALRATPLRSLPPCLAAGKLWEGKVVDAVMKAVLQALRDVDAARVDEAAACAGELVGLFRLRGCLARVVPYSLARPEDFGGVIFPALDGNTGEELLGLVVPLPGAYACLRAAVAQAERARRAKAGGAKITRGLGRLLTSGTVSRDAVEVVVHVLAGAARGAANAAAVGPVGRAVRRAVLTHFGDTRRLPPAAGSACDAAVYFLERLPKDELQGGEEQLLPAVLQGISARLGSPILSHRRMACVAARCLSIVLDPKEPVEFEDFPAAYERWMENAEGAGEAAAAGRRRAEEVKREQKTAAVKRATQDCADECAFDDGDSEEEEEEEEEEAEAGQKKTAADAFWSSDGEEEAAAPQPLPHGGDAEASETPGAPQQVHLQDALKVLQGKKEKHEEVEAVMQALPARVKAERLEEVRAVGGALFHALLHLTNAFDAADFQRQRHAALVELLCRIPEDTARSLVEQVWGANMGTGQRTEALMLLGAAARALRHHELLSPDALGPAVPRAAAGSDDPALTGVAAIRRRRPYPPIEPEVSAALAAAKEAVAERLETKTRRAVRGAGAAAAVVFANLFEKHCGLFVYNLIGTADRKHHNPFDAEDPIVALHLLRYLWDVCELLNGCGAPLSVAVRVAILEYLWAAVDHPLPLILGHVLAAAAAAILSLPTHALDVPAMQRWCGLAEEVARGRRGRDDPACRTLAGHLVSAVQTRLDEVLAPFHQPLAEADATAPLIEVL